MLGTSELPRVVVTFLVAFFPLVLSVASGLVSVPPELIELGRACRANRWTELWRIRLPYAVPFIFSGLKAAIALAVVGAVVAEFVNADAGLGYLIQTSTAFFKVQLAWGALVILSIMGIVLFQIVVAIERIFFPWSPGIDKPTALKEEHAMPDQAYDACVRNGRVLDIGGHRAPPADILIAGDTIAEVGAPGLAAPADAARRRRHRPADPPGPHQRPHPRPRESEQGHGRPLDARAPAHRRALDQRQPRGRGQVSDAPTSARSEMLMKGCTACYDLTVEFPQPTPEGLGACAKAYADAGMRAVVAPMVAEPLVLRGHPRPARVPCRPALQKEVERLRACALRGEPRRHAPGARGLALRSRAGASRRRANHPASLQRRVHAWPAHAWRASSASACTAMCRNPRRRSSSASRSTARRRRRTCRTSGLLGPDFVAAHGVWLDDDDIRRARRPRRLGGPQPRQQHAARQRHRRRSSAMLERQLNVGIGTDGASCCDNQNMYESLRVASYGSKAQGPGHRALARERGDPRGGHRRQRPGARLRRQARPASPRATRPTSFSSTSTTSTGFP